MPKPYYVPRDDPGSVGEQLLGRGDTRRATKTFIEDGPMAMFLGMFRGYPEMVITMGRRLHAEEYDIPFEDVTPEMVLEIYPEARELIQIHQQIIEHKGSQSGFLVDRYTGSTPQEEVRRQPDRKESSGDAGGGRRWG